MAKNIIICGVGGQGTVLAAKVLSQAAIANGERVLSAETIGMAQRGGSVVSHVRIGGDVYSPLVPQGQADVLIAFSGKAFDENEMLSYLEKVADNVIAIDTDQACKDLGSSKIVNMVLLGAVSKTGLIKKDDLKNALKPLVKPEFYELNIKALEYN